jgi:hypothetical protein
MVLTAQGLRLVQLRRIRIRNVHDVKKECRATGDAGTGSREIDLLCHEKRAESAEAATEMKWNEDATLR